MTRKIRRCKQCGAELPRGAGPNRLYCDSTCRGRHWRRVQHHEEVYRRAVEQSLDVIRGGALWASGRCPVCRGFVSVRKRTDAVYCSPRCRTRAWRLRGDASERPLGKPSRGDG